MFARRQKPSVAASPIAGGFAQEGFMQGGFMRVHPGDLIIGLMMICFAGLGVLLALRALDAEMSVFGVSLACFSLLFLAGQFRRHSAASAKLTSMEHRHG